MSPLRAVIGCAAMPPEGQVWTGEVCAVFRRSAHLRIEERYITLGTTGIVPHPCSILWDGFPSMASLGMVCRITPRGMEFDNHNRLEFKGMSRFFPVLYCRESASDNAMLKAMKASAEAVFAFPDKNALCLQAVGRRDLPGKGASIMDQALHRQVEKQFQALSQALQERNPILFQTAANGLAGLGQGLTPFGDDFLAGVFAALRFRHQSGRDTPFTTYQVVQTANRTSRLTSGFSGFLLQNAAMGLIAEPLADWLYAIYRGDTVAGARLVGDMAAIGHSSGLDTLAGMLFSLQQSIGAISWTN